MLRQTLRPMGALWSHRGEYANWLAIARLRSSFLSKATTALSLTTFALSNFTKLFVLLDIDPWRLRLIFCGALVFLIGYLLAAWRSPPEFKTATALDEIVSRMLVVSDFQFFKSRRWLATVLVEEIGTNRPRDLPRGYEDFLTERIAETAALQHWDEREAATLYYADLNLRQFVKPRSRYLALLFLGAGCLLLLIPTLDSIVRIVFGRTGG